MSLRLFRVHIMGKVFKALEKSGIDTSLLGDESQLGMKDKEVRPHDTKAEEGHPLYQSDSEHVENDHQQESDQPESSGQHKDQGGPVQPEITKESKPDVSSSTSADSSPRKGKQSGSWDERLVKVTALGSIEAESFRVLRSKILYPADGRPVPKTILVTSAVPSEGKGFVASNLGISLARGMDQSSLLVDCDLRRPSLAKMFGLSNEFGLVDCLQEGKGIDQYLQKTSIDKLCLLASGKKPVNPAELLGSSRMEKIINELAERYEDRLIIFDSAPGQVAPESLVLAQHVDCVVLVVRYGKSNRNYVQKLVESIGKDKIVGVVFNGVKTTMIEDRVFGEYDSYGDYFTPDEE